MRVRLIHPSPLMYSEVYLRLEPLGLERVASAVRAHGHQVHLMDLQVYRHTRARAAQRRPPIGRLRRPHPVPSILDWLRRSRGEHPTLVVAAGSRCGDN